MLPEIQTINSSLCDLEKVCGVIFNRETAIVQEQIGVKVLHLLVQDYVQQTTDSGGQIISCFSVIKPNNQVTSLANVLFNDGTTFNNLQLVDKDGNVLANCNPFVTNPEPEETEEVFPWLFIQPSIEIENIKDNGDGTYHVVLTFDVTIFGFISIKIGTIEFDV